MKFIYLYTSTKSIADKVTNRVLLTMNSINPETLSAVLETANKHGQEVVITSDGHFVLRPKQSASVPQPQPQEAPVQQVQTQQPVVQQYPATQQYPAAQQFTYPYPMMPQMLPQMAQYMWPYMYSMEQMQQMMRQQSEVQQIYAAQSNLVQTEIEAQTQQVQEQPQVQAQQTQPQVQTQPQTQQTQQPQAQQDTPTKQILTKKPKKQAQAQTQETQPQTQTKGAWAKVAAAAASKPAPVAPKTTPAAAIANVDIGSQTIPEGFVTGDHLNRATRNGGIPIRPICYTNNCNGNCTDFRGVDIPRAGKTQNVAVHGNAYGSVPNTANFCVNGGVTGERTCDNPKCTNNHVLVYMTPEQLAAARELSQRKREQYQSRREGGRRAYNADGDRPVSPKIADFIHAPGVTIEEGSDTDDEPKTLSVSITGLKISN